MARKKNKLSPYSTGRRRVHRAGPVAKSLMTECVRNGTLDVRCETGEVFTNFGKRRKRKLRLDRDGYLQFDLQSERKDRRGKVTLIRRGKKLVKRYIRRQLVRVHRLVLAKKLAIEKHGDKWQERFVEIPPTIDVDHIDLDRANNRGKNLRLRLPIPNRQRQPFTEAERIAANRAADLPF